MSDALSSVESSVLIDRLLSDNPQIRMKSWDLLYKSYFSMVRDFIMANSGTDADATDMFQDTLVIFLRNIKKGSFRKEASLKTYIFSISRNLWIDELSRRKKTMSISYDDIDGVSAYADNNYLMTIQVVGMLMNDLKADCRRILTEYYYNNRSMNELKDLLNVSSVQAAKNKKWRCLGYLIKLFKERSPIRMQTD